MMPKGCEWPEGCEIDGVPVFHLTKIDSDEIDGDYCRVHAQRRSSQMGRELRARQAAARAALAPTPTAPGTGSACNGNCTPSGPLYDVACPFHGVKAMIEALAAEQAPSDEP